jgi:hypothetical protein
MIVMPTTALGTWLANALLLYTGRVTWTDGAPAMIGLGEVTFAEAATMVTGSL